MRKLMMTVAAVAGLGFVTGCQQRSEVQSEREDVAEAQSELGQAQHNVNTEVAETRQDAQEDVNEAQRNLNEEQKDLAQAQQEQAAEQRDEAIGGSGMATSDAKAEEVKGTIKSASSSNLTLIVPDKNNQVMSFQANQQVQVTRDDKPVALSDLKPGDEVRASYQMENGQMVLRSIDVTKQSAQHPGKQKK